MFEEPLYATTLSAMADGRTRPHRSPRLYLPLIGRVLDRNRWFITTLAQGHMFAYLTLDLVTVVNLGLRVRVEAVYIPQVALTSYFLKSLSTFVQRLC